MLCETTYTYGVLSWLPLNRRLVYLIELLCWETISSTCCRPDVPDGLQSSLPPFHPSLLQG